jgi:glutathione S-transferase
MIKLYHAPRTRSVRILWLLEELGLDYELETLEFTRPTQSTYAQATPLGKLPVIEDGDVVICESGAIVEYILERYDAEHRLAPRVGSPLRGRFLQWVHFAESTAYPPIGIAIWYTIYRPDSPAGPEAIADQKGRASEALDFLEEHLGEGPWVLGEAFSGADVMLGFTLSVAQVMGVLGDRHPRIQAYLARLQARPAFQKASSGSL